VILPSPTFGAEKLREAVRLIELIVVVLVVTFLSPKNLRRII